MTRAQRTIVFLVCVGLTAGNLIVYARVSHYGFVNFDDPEYIDSNSIVSHGLTKDGVRWALTTARTGNWFPLTWLSHMLDVQFYGMNAGGHHVTNLMLHIMSALVLFGVLYRMTTAIGASAFVAALFSLHPLQVESVAWIAERKNVLSTFLWMLTLWTYVSYVRRPHVGRYLLVLLPYVLGLMAKPMLVTLPFTLLLVDVWPLRRLPLAAEEVGPLPPRDRSSVALDLLWEKMPMFALALTSSMITVAAQRQNQIPFDSLPLLPRLENAVISYAAYMGKMAWPARLAAFYSYPLALPALRVAGALLVLCVISAFVVWQHDRRPYLPVGWAWYLGTLVPVIGIVQVGTQAMADRYAYVPLIGLWICVAWAARDLVTGPRTAAAASAAAAIILAVYGIVAYRQVGYWKSSVLLWQRASEVSSGALVEANLGNAYASEGNFDAAIAQFDKVVRLKPNRPELRYQFGFVLESRGQLDRAVIEYSEAVRQAPRFAAAHGGLGSALAKQGKIDEAIVHYSQALRIRPDPEEHYLVAQLLQRRGRSAEAIQHLQAALLLQPDFPDARRALDLIPESASKPTAKFAIP